MSKTTVDNVHLSVCLSVSREYSSLHLFRLAPRYAPGNLTLHNTSSTSLKVIWSGVNISLIHGIFRGYDIWFNAKPQFPDAYVTYGNQEARRKRRSTFVLDQQLTTVGVGYETVELTELAKYTNYSIQVMALSKFVGVQSISAQLVTDEDSKLSFF